MLTGSTAIRYLFASCAPSARARRSADLAMLLVFLLLVLPTRATAHDGGWAAAGDGWLRWNSAPLVALNIGFVSSLYIYGLVKFWRRSGMGRGVSILQAASFGAGIAALAVTLLSPLDALSGELFTAHMIQHMVLMNLAAPLLVLGSPALVWSRVLPRPWQAALNSWRGRNLPSATGSLLWRPWLGWLLYAAALWLWHLPVLYHAALDHPRVHDLQHLSLFAAAFLFWRVLLEPDRRRRLSRGLGVVYLFTTSLHATLLGVFMALAPRVWYAGYAGGAAAWNLTPLEDQQLAGLIMWMPACMVYAVAAAVLFVLWLGEPQGLRED